MVMPIVRRDGVPNAIISVREPNEGLKNKSKNNPVINNIVKKK
jgi:hypothetical protein